VKDGKVIGKASGLSGGAGRPAAVQAVYDAALSAAGVKASDVEKVVSTGKGKFDGAFSADQLSETVAAAKAARMFEPKATTVVDIGADEILVATMAGEKISEFVINQKCTAGLGLFLEGMADRLDMTIDEVGKLEGPGSVTVNDGCVVFAELDALSLLNRGTDAKEIVKALNEACAWRANSTLNDIYRPDNVCVVLFGGMTQNGAFIKSLERISGIKFVIPDEAVYAGAIGAAALAAD
jgi:predicted CoA-substrate-specific enzyme activase